MNSPNAPIVTKNTTGRLFLNPCRSGGVDLPGKILKETALPDKLECMLCREITASKLWTMANVGDEPESIDGNIIIKMYCPKCNTPQEIGRVEKEAYPVLVSVEQIKKELPVATELFHKSTPQLIEMYKQSFMKFDGSLNELYEPLAQSILDEFVKDRKSAFQAILALTIAGLTAKSIKLLRLNEPNYEYVARILRDRLKDDARKGIKDANELAKNLVNVLNVNQMLAFGTPNQTEINLCKEIRNTASELKKWSAMTHEQKRVVTFDKNRALESAAIIDNIIANVLQLKVRDMRVTQDIADEIHSDISQSLFQTFERM